MHERLWGTGSSLDVGRPVAEVIGESCHQPYGHDHESQKNRCAMRNKVLHRVHPATGSEYRNLNQATSHWRVLVKIADRTDTVVTVRNRERHDMARVTPNQKNG